MKLPLRIFFIFVLALFPFTSFGQTRGGKRSCRILFFDPAPGAPEKLYLFDGKNSREVDLPSMNFSDIYELPPGNIRLALLPQAPATLKQIASGAPSIDVSEDLVDFYLLVTSDSKNTVAPVRLQVIDAGSDKIKAGQLLWLNLTPYTLGGEVGTERLVVKPKGRRILNAPAKKRGDYPVQLFFQIPGDELVYPLCSTSWRHDPLSKNIVFINVEPGQRTPRVRGFSDFRSPRGRDDR